MVNKLHETKKHYIYKEQEQIIFEIKQDDTCQYNEILFHNGFYNKKNEFYKEIIISNNQLMYMMKKECSLELLVSFSFQDFMMFQDETLFSDIKKNFYKEWNEQYLQNEMTKLYKYFVFSSSDN